MSNIAQLRDTLNKVADEFGTVVESKQLRAGTDYLPPTGKVVGAEEFRNLLQASADMWLTCGRFSDKFEAEFPKFWGLKKSLLVNSGSSANLLAFATLTSSRLKEKALKAGDEMVTTACGFPTTVAPAIQYGLKPVFVDVDVATHNAAVEAIEAAITPKTKIVMIAHALGNPFRADLLAKVCEERGIWLVEDCCDALGAKIKGAHVGSFGSLATCSFYPAHHMTMGEGGAVVMNHANLHKIAMSFRDWGRDCWCPPGISNSCGIRFDWQLGDLPQGYDHKYIYSHVGFNLKSTDFQAAVGLAQLQRLPGFIEARRKNFDYLTKCLKDAGAEEHLVLPHATPETDPSWFGYFMCLRSGGHDRRAKMTRFLEDNKVGTRLLFGGNLTKQPAFQGVDYRIHGKLTNTDKIMNEGFWVGIWPGLDKSCLEYIAGKIVAACKK
ncbi:MAG: lipopolysaccharide biosynthesis protein RfbH [Bdellovibrionales bacterium]|nr:lipopolysaccharide biosynthesis protein RfbH [Bdellovibrionales bacterium]